MNSRLMVGCGIFLISTATGCGNGKPSPVGDSRAASPVTASAAPKEASSAKWEAEGDRIRGDKKANAKKSKGFKATNADDYAYRSEPIDITGNGEYTLYFGPVDSEFDFPKSPISIAYNFPTDVTFTPKLGEPSTVSHKGSRYLKLPLEVINLNSAYTGFSAWAY